MRTSGTPAQNLVTIVSVMILVGTEVFGVALAGGWAIAGLFELGEAARWLLMAGFCAMGAWAMLLLWRRCVAIEPIHRRA